MQDIIRYILLALCLAVGCAGYAESASRDIDGCDDRHAESTGEDDTTCGELREYATYSTVVAVSKNF